MGLRRGAEGEIEHPDAINVLVGHQPVNAANHVGVGALALGIEGLDGDQTGVGRYPAIVTVTRCSLLRLMLVTWVAWPLSSLGALQTDSV